MSQTQFISWFLYILYFTIVICTNNLKNVTPSCPPPPPPHLRRQYTWMISRLSFGSGHPGWLCRLTWAALHQPLLLVLRTAEQPGWHDHLVEETWRAHVSANEEKSSVKYSCFASSKIAGPLASSWENGPPVTQPALWNSWLVLVGRSKCGLSPLYIHGWIEAEHQLYHWAHSEHLSVDNGCLTG